jgi:hypothetical protein
MNIGTIGVWCDLDALPSTEAVAATQQIEGLGYRTLWIPEAVGLSGIPCNC